MPIKGGPASRPGGKLVWKVYLDTVYGSYIACQPNIQPSFVVGKKSQKRYTEVASFLDEAHARDYANTMNLGKPADILDYVLLEHEILEQSRPLTKEESAELDRLIQSAQEATGRKCFGKCSTMKGRTACKTCYFSRNATWRLCADIAALEKLKKLTSIKRIAR